VSELEPIWGLCKSILLLWALASSPKIRGLIILQSCNHQDSMVLAQKQTHRSLGQNRKTRNEPTTIWPTNLRQSRKEYPVEKRQSLQQMLLGKLDSNMQKNETSYTKIN